MKVWRLCSTTRTPGFLYLRSVLEGDDHVYIRMSKSERTLYVGPHGQNIGHMPTLILTLLFIPCTCRIMCQITKEGAPLA